MKEVLSLKQMLYGFIAIIFLLSGCALAEAEAVEGDFYIVAHRGASAYAPENTLASYELAENMNADFIELDIHLTKDNEIIVMHDHDVKETTEASGEISDYTLAQLKELSANTNEKKAEKMASEPQKNLRVPSLKEVFEEFGDEMHFMIELKNPKKNKGIEEELAVLLEEYDMIPTEENKESRVYVHSFHKSALKRLYEINPKIPLLQLVTFDKGEKEELAGKELEDVKKYSTAIGVSHEYLDKEFIQDMEENNLIVYATAVDDAKEARKMKKIGARGIFTDKPDLLEE